MTEKLTHEKFDEMIKQALEKKAPQANPQVILQQLLKKPKGA